MKNTYQVSVSRSLAVRCSRVGGADHRHLVVGNWSIIARHIWGVTDRRTRADGPSAIPPEL